MSQDELAALGMFNDLITCGSAIGAVILFFVIVMMYDRLGKIEKGINELAQLQEYQIAIAALDSENLTEADINNLVDEELITKNAADRLVRRYGWRDLPDVPTLNDKRAPARPDQPKTGWEAVD